MDPKLPMIDLKSQKLIQKGPIAMQIRQKWSRNPRWKPKSRKIM